MLKILKAFKTRQELLNQIFQKKTVKNAILNIDKNNMAYLNENLEKFPDQMRKIRFKSRVMREIIKNKYLDSDPKLKQELIFLWGQRAFNTEDLERYIQQQVQLPVEYFDDQKMKMIDQRFDRQLKDLEVSTVIKYIRYKSALVKIFLPKQVNDLIADKLQYEDQNALFQEFYKIGFFSNNYIYALIDMGLWEEFTAGIDKKDLFDKLTQNSIYLNDYLREFFKQHLHHEELTVQQMIKDLDNKQYYEQQLYLENLKLQDLLKIKQYQFVEKKSNIRLPLQLLQEVTKEKCSVQNIVQNIQILQHLIKQWNRDELESVEDILDDFVNSLNVKIYAKIAHVNYFFYILHFWKILLQKNDFAKEYNYISSRGYQVLEHFCKSFTELFTQFCFKESINTNLQSMEDITYVKGSTLIVPQDVVKYDYSESQIDEIIEVFEKFCEYNLGTQQQWELFSQFFEFYMMELNQHQFARFLFVICQSNIGISKIEEKAVLYIQNLIEKTMDYQVAFSSAVFLTLIQNQEPILWSTIRNVIFNNMEKCQEMGQQLTRYLFICKQIHKRQPDNYLQGLQLDFHYENIILDSTKFSKTLKYYFDYLFLEDIETNVVIDQINVSYSQGKKALLALERKYIVGFTHNPTGEAVLAMIFLRNFFSKLEILPITEFNEFEKNNERMHFLRKKLIGWKTDIDAKREFYNKQVDFVEEKIHIKKL